MSNKDILKYKDILFYPIQPMVSYTGMPKICHYLTYYPLRRACPNDVVKRTRLKWYVIWACPSNQKGRSPVYRVFQVATISDQGGCLGYKSMHLQDQIRLVLYAVISGSKNVLLHCGMPLYPGHGFASLSVKDNATLSEFLRQNEKDKRNPIEMVWADLKAYVGSQAYFLK